MQNDFDSQCSSKQSAKETKKKKPIKKQRKDPNEPQKPVSPYALFFRDKQNEIKQQLGNPSFGEISKVVAHMWENIAPDIKEQYKHKAAAAKKEYLRQLAAYRAVQISHQIPNIPHHQYQTLYPQPTYNHHFPCMNSNPTRQYASNDYQQQYNSVRPMMDSPFYGQLEWNLNIQW